MNRFSATMSLAMTLAAIGTSVWAQDAEPGDGAAEAQADAPVATVETADATGEAADCPAMTALQDGRGKVEQVRSLFDKELAAKSNVITAYNTLGKALRKAVAGADYDPACYRQTLGALKEVTADTPEGVQEDGPASELVRGWADKCSKDADTQMLTQCFTDITDAASDGDIDDGHVITLVNSLPLTEVEMDDAQMEEFLSAVKEQVEAGTISDYQQSEIVKALIGG